MTYDAFEKSVNLGRPFEVYEFKGPAGIFRYASGPQERIVDDEVYEPLSITRTSVVVSSILDSPQTMDFNVPIRCDLAFAYTRHVIPDTLAVRVLRAHDGTDYNTDFKVEWSGEAVGYRIANSWFIISTVSRLQSMILGASTSVMMQNACNNEVYDARCQAVEGDHSFETTVALVDAVRVHVADMNYPNGELELGRIVCDRTGESRTITSAEDDELEVAYPFYDLVVGDAVTLILGCDNKMDTCHQRFNNVEHYTGFRFVPVSNPFTED